MPGVQGRQTLMLSTASPGYPDWSFTPIPKFDDRFARQKCLVKDKWNASVEEAESVDVCVPSKHLTGASCVDLDKRQSKVEDTGSKGKKASPKQTTENVSMLTHGEIARRQLVLQTFTTAPLPTS
jgi:hypothetical protein